MTDIQNVQWLNLFACLCVCHSQCIAFAQIAHSHNPLQQHAINTIVFPIIYLVADSLKCFAARKKEGKKINTITKISKGTKIRNIQL